MPVRGPSLRGMIQQIAHLRSSDARASFGEALGRAALEEVEAQFARGADPYGEGWQPLAQGRRSPLQGSGRLRRSFRVEVTTDGFRLTTPVEFFGVHQLGATIPARQSAGGQELSFSPRSGRLLRASRVRKLKLVYISTARAHKVGQIVIPQRQVVPEASTGGLGGSAWGERLNNAARAWMREQMRK